MSATLVLASEQAYKVFNYYQTMLKNSPSHLTRFLLHKDQIGILRPHLESFAKLNVDFVLRQISWVLADLVRQLLHSPPRTYAKIMTMREKTEKNIYNVRFGPKMRLWFLSFFDNH